MAKQTRLRVGQRVCLARPSFHHGFNEYGGNTKGAYGTVVQEPVDSKVRVSWDKATGSTYKSIIDDVVHLNTWIVPTSVLVKVKDHAPQRMAKRR